MIQDVVDQHLCELHFLKKEEKERTKGGRRNISLSAEKIKEESLNI